MGAGQRAIAMPPSPIRAWAESHHQLITVISIATAAEAMC